MNISEIKDWVFPEDKMKVAVKYEADYSYITKLLNGQRKANSQTAVSILNDLTALAEANVQTKYLKEEYLRA